MDTYHTHTLHIHAHIQNTYHTRPPMHACMHACTDVSEHIPQLCAHRHTQVCAHTFHTHIYPFKPTDKNLFIYDKLLSTHTKLTPHPPHKHIYNNLHVFAITFTECKHNTYTTLLHISQSHIPYRQTQWQNLDGFSKPSTCHTQCTLSAHSCTCWLAGNPPVTA